MTMHFILGRMKRINRRKWKKVTNSFQLLTENYKLKLEFLKLGGWHCNYALHLTENEKDK